LGSIESCFIVAQMPWPEQSPVSALPPGQTRRSHAGPKKFAKQLHFPAAVQRPAPEHGNRR
jgi:hypothetical protein